MQHDYDFQDDPHLCQTPLDMETFDAGLDDKYWYIRTSHFFALLILVAIIGFAAGGYLVKMGVL